MVQCFSLQVECHSSEIGKGNVDDSIKDILYSLQQGFSSFEDVFVEPKGYPIEDCKIITFL